MERLKKVGDVKKFASREIDHSRLGIGFEKLDRMAFDPENAYDKVAAVGVKWVRIQSGWNRTEKEKGVYSFEWLDSIVDNLVDRGLKPWICLCYGNSLYNERAAKVFGAVGCPPQTEEERAAWSRYVTAVVKRYKGKVEWYEVWNEPDGVWCWKHGPSGTEYGELVKLTAAAIKQGNPEAKVIGGSQCMFGLRWLSAVLETGAAQVMDGYTYHNYLAHEEILPAMVRALTALVHWYNPKIKIIQGETGTQSRSDGCGALRGGAWTQLKQAKFMARHTITDFQNNVMFSSYFSCLDMMEALNGTVGDTASYKDFGYFGILGADFDENGKATGSYSPKLSYRTLQTLASVFREDFELANLPVILSPGPSGRILGQEELASHFTQVGFSKPNGSHALAYWKPTDLMTETYDSTITINTAAMPGKPHLVDLLDGSVYEIPDSMIKRSWPAKKIAIDGTVTMIPEEQTFDPRLNYYCFHQLPVRDYPLLLTFGDFADFE